MDNMCYDFAKEEAEFQLIEARKRLTIIIALKESDDSLLIGADSVNQESDNLKAQHITKLFRHKTHNIAWGFVGNRDIGKNEFTPWLQSLAINGDWQWFKDVVADKIAELNGKQREREEKAGISPKADSLIACLLVGWLDGQPQIYEFTNDARVDSYFEDQFRAIGSGILVAYGGYYALKRIESEELDKLMRLRIALEVTTNWVLTCGGVPHVMRVKKDGIKVI